MIELITPDAASSVREKIVEILQGVRIKRLGMGAVIPLSVILFLKLRMIRQSFRSVLGAPPTQPYSWVVDLAVFIAVVSFLPLAFTFFDQFLLMAQNGLRLLFLVRLSRALLLCLFILALMRMFVPMRVAWSRKIVFAALGGVFLYLTNYAFTNLLGTVLRMNTLYGVFTSVPVFLLWIYIFWRTVTLCVVFACEPHLIVTDDGRVKVRGQ